MWHRKVKPTPQQIEHARKLIDKGGARQDVAVQVIDDFAMAPISDAGRRATSAPRRRYLM